MVYRFCRGLLVVVGVLVVVEVVFIVDLMVGVLVLVILWERIGCFVVELSDWCVVEVFFVLLG